MEKGHAKEKPIRFSAVPAELAFSPDGAVRSPGPRKVNWQAHAFLRALNVTRVPHSSLLRKSFKEYNEKKPSIADLLVNDGMFL
jgi:hypothetical protein